METIVESIEQTFNNDKEVLEYEESVQGAEEAPSEEGRSRKRARSETAQVLRAHSHRCLQRPMSLHRPMCRSQCASCTG